VTGEPLRICLVGAGPRGTSVLERLCANAALIRAGRPVTVDVVDPHPPGPGAVWRTDQSGHLLMNTIAAQISLYADASVACTGPIVPGPSLYEWAATGPAPIGPNEYPTRAFYGRYLDWVFRRLIREAPAGLSIRVHRAAALALDDDADGRQTVTLDDGRQLSGLDVVVLTLGHGPLTADRDEDEARRFAARHCLGYRPPGSPADQELDAVLPGDRVLLRGLGLAFFDYLALFTEGRGGRFDTVGGRLSYRRSGREPRLFAGSRRGLPYHARGENEKGVAGRHQPQYLVPAVIERLRASADAGEPVSFRQAVWPLIDREVRTAYYHAWIARERGEQTAARFIAAYRDCADERELLDAWGVPAGRRWDWSAIERPYGDRVFTGPADFHDWMLGHLRDDVAAARQGNLTNPLKSALDVLRDIRNEVRLVVDHGGISGSSYRHELQSWYSPLNAYASIGPPARRIEELVALVEAGVLDLIGPGLWVRADEEARAFRAGSSMVPGSEIVADTLIEARLPETDLRRSANPLLRYLWATGQSRPYRIGHYETGGLAVTRRPYRVIDAAGRPHPRRYAFGVPTEAVHWLTAAGIRPGVGSVTLEDADAIARAALTAQPAALSRQAEPLPI
jgi:uncharacterized NAD(P)/FAD-binding protein YdhS